MNNLQHVSDEDLKLVVLEKANSTEQTYVEDHVSQCELCQNRILELAVDSQWRSDIVEKCDAVRNEIQNDEPTNYKSSSDNGTPLGDAFDLGTVERMLDEVLQPPTHPEMRGRLGRYEIEGVIGCGGMGVVLRGFDRDLYRPVAIKMILPRLANGIAKQRFTREARAAAVVLHPNVIAIHGIEYSNGVPWIAMPLIVGPTLKELIEEHGPLSEREIVRIGKQVASGLAAAHSQGLVHRDIKPENVMVDNQVNRVVITDFGLARQLSDDPMTQTGFLAGTIHYMSPEQSRGAEIDARSDLFSLGGLLFFLATGQHPFSASSPMGVIHAIGHQPHARVQALNNEISATLAETIDRLLEKDPDKRFQSSVEVETFLNDYLFHLQQPLLAPAPKISPFGTAPSGRGLSTASRLAFGILVALLVGAGVWWGMGQMPVQELDPKTPPKAVEEAKALAIRQAMQASEKQQELLSKTEDKSDLDKKIDQWLSEHSEAWAKLRDEPALTVEKIEAVRKKTLDKFPAMSDLMPTHIRRIKNAGLLQSGPARAKAMERIAEFEKDPTIEGAMAAYLMFDFAVEVPMLGYPKGETPEVRLAKQKKSFEHFAHHPQLQALFNADNQLMIFTFLRQVNSPATLKQYYSELKRVKNLMIESLQESTHSEYVDCFEVVKVAGDLQGEELESLRKQLHSFSQIQLAALKAKTEIESPQMHKHMVGSVEAQIKYLETVVDTGTLIGSPAPELNLVWSSDDSVESWKDTRGKVCVLYFSTFGCGPCVKSAPKLIELNEMIASHGHMADKVKFIGLTSEQGHVPLKEGVVACEDDFDKECKLTRQYIAESKINWPIVYTKETVFNSAFGVKSVPHMVILDSDGVIRDTFNPYTEEVGNILKRIGAVVK